MSAAEDLVSDLGVIEPGPPKFRRGAERMLRALGRMAPLRLTKTQWGTVAKLSSKSGTFSTYLSELRRAGLVEEDSAGFTLTAAGFAHIGGKPEPMDAEELRRHYLGILRAGASRMLEQVLNAYPEAIARDELAQRAGLEVTAGTFSTYLSDLRRNGLIEVGPTGEITANEILIGN